MRHLILRNFGPIKEADINLANINIIIGPQATGKSCLLKTACFCSWVEKRVMVGHSFDGFDASSFADAWVGYHEIDSYLKPNTVLEYETDFISFKYNRKEESFTPEFKEDLTLNSNYKRPKISYIPAERNLVAVIPAWEGLKLSDDILDFMKDWDEARKARENEDILNLGVKYHYDSSVGLDKVEMSDGATYLPLRNSSSGFQSLIPMVVFISYLHSSQFLRKNKRSVKSDKDLENFVQVYLEYIRAKNLQGQLISDKEALGRTLHEDVVRLEKITHNYFTTDHSELFLEEPENNLFPPTQSKFIDWLLDTVSKHKSDRVFIATHSPYILNQFLEKEKMDFNIFISAQNNGSTIVKTLSKENVQTLYDYGIDAFFNFDSIV